MTREAFQTWATELMSTCAPDLAFTNMIDQLRDPKFTNGVNAHDPHIQDYVIRIADAAKAFERAHAELYGYLITHHSPKTS